MNDQWESLSASIIDCRKCPRLVEWRELVARQRRRAYQEQEYWGRPVTGFGDVDARVLVVGLAPGAHGANRTGRIFTGDGSGEFLFRALHRAGFASQAQSIAREDGLQLSELYISAVCRCAPPANRPTPEEIAACLPFLERELELLKNLEGLVVLGQIAFEYTLRLFRRRGVELPRLPFGHGIIYNLGADLPWLLVSYHPSRQNTQTGRLTDAMFDHIWGQVRGRLEVKI